MVLSYTMKVPGGQDVIKRMFEASRFAQSFMTSFFAVLDLMRRLCSSDIAVSTAHSRQPLGKVETCRNLNGRQRRGRDNAMWHDCVEPTKKLTRTHRLAFVVDELRRLDDATDAALLVTLVMGRCDVFYEICVFRKLLRLGTRDDVFLRDASNVCEPSSADNTEEVPTSEQSTPVRDVFVLHHHRRVP